MSNLAGDLLDWYEANRIAYPWRLTKDPYRIWLSEILLQQTRISVALPFYERILRRYPGFQSLAEADTKDFLSMWSGIGYYRRAENMLACAKQVVQNHGGCFPSDWESLLKLPGIGPYTAGAIRNLCFALLTPALDGNADRVLARLIGCKLASGSRLFQAAMTTAFLKHGRREDPAAYMQALMELGERICLPRPNCNLCPLKKHCIAVKDSQVAEIPVRRSRIKQKHVHWYFLMLRKGSAFLFLQDTQRPFLKNAWLFPDLLSDHPLSVQSILREFKRRWKIHVEQAATVGNVSHTVTFRKITAHVLSANEFTVPHNRGVWLTPGQLEAYHTSSVVAKILRITEYSTAG